MLPVGIDSLLLNFLLYTNKNGNFKRTITLGRQNIVYNRRDLKHLRRHLNPVEYQCLIKYGRKQKSYVDNLLRDYFGASIVDSIDKSEFEGATIISDLNNEISTELKAKYDTVIDGGTLEHIYNIPQALNNASSLCKPGGQIIHALPANNVCGHGFWQMSPELFFTLYSDKNGYQDTEVFLARPSDPNNFYKVIRPKKGKRINIYSNDEVYLYVRTVRKGTKFFHENVQQSDYVYLWDNKSHQELETHSRFKDLIRKNDIIFKTALKIYDQPYWSFHRLSTRNSNLVKVNIDHLLFK